MLLTARDALSDRLVRVTDEQRPGTVAAHPDAIFAVFSSEQDLFLGFVTSEQIAQTPGRIFADLLVDTTLSAVDDSTPLNEVFALMEQRDCRILPVTGASGTLLGAVTRARILELLLERHKQLSNALRQEQQRLRLWSSRLSELNQASGALMKLMAHSENEDDMAQNGLNVLTTLIRAQYGAVGIIDDGGNLSRFLYTGLSKEQADRIGQLPEGKGLLGVVVRENQAVRLDNMSEDPRSAGFPPSHPPMKSLLAVPVSDNGKVYGRVYLCDKLDDAPFSAEDETLASTFAHSLALALIHSREHVQRREAEERALRLLKENRRLTKQLFKAQEEERKRVARELHDELGQHLTGMYADIELIQTLSRDFQPQIYDRAQGLEVLLHHFYGVVHGLIEDLRPALLDQLGLVEALQELLEKYREQHADIAWKLTIIGNLQDIGEALRITVYRIVQEALTNIVRHARASEAQVVVCRSAACTGHLCRTYFSPPDREKDTVRMLIKDNGKGLAGKKKNGGLGLLGIRERVESLDGSFSLESRKGNGTVMAIEIPIKPDGYATDDPAAADR